MFNGMYGARMFNHSFVKTGSADIIATLTQSTKFGRTMKYVPNLVSGSATASSIPFRKSIPAKVSLVAIGTATALGLVEVEANPNVLNGIATAVGTADIIRGFKSNVAGAANVIIQSNSVIVGSGYAINVVTVSSIAKGLRSGGAIAEVKASASGLFTGIRDGRGADIRSEAIVSAIIKRASFQSSALIFAADTSGKSIKTSVYAANINGISQANGFSVKRSVGGRMDVILEVDSLANSFRLASGTADIYIENSVNASSNYIVVNASIAELFTNVASKITVFRWEKQDDPVTDWALIEFPNTNWAGQSFPRTDWNEEIEIITVWTDVKTPSTDWTKKTS